MSVFKNVRYLPIDSDNDSRSGFSCFCLQGVWDLCSLNQIHVLFTLSHSFLQNVVSGTGLCMWPEGFQVKTKDKCWSGDCMLRASGWSKWSTETRPLSQLLSSSNTFCLETFSWQLCYNYELSPRLGWNQFPEAWDVKQASQMQTSGAWKSLDTRCLWAVRLSFL